jgi:glycosyltransferase involved in cell wall biosynthesis
MRVALVASFGPDYCIEFAEVASTVCDVLFLADARSVSSRISNSERLTVVGLDWPRHRHLRNAKFLFELYRHIRGWAPDLIHFLGEKNVWLNLLPILLRPTPVVTTVHDIACHPGDTDSKKVPRALVKWFIRQSNAVIVHGEGLREAADGHLPVRLSRIFVLPHLPLFYYWRLAEQSELGRKADDCFRILFFGRLFEYKGLDYLLTAALLVKDIVRNVKFVVAGTGDQQLIARLREMPRDLFDIRARFIRDEEVAELFSEADLVVLPYVEASQSGVLMIAMAFGLPVVATNVGEIGTAVETHRIGLVVPPRDSRALAAAITRLATDKAMYARFSANVQAAIRTELAPPAFGERIKSVYRDILEALHVGSMT